MLTRVPAFERERRFLRVPAYVDFCPSRKQGGLRIPYEVVQGLSSGGPKHVLDVNSEVGHTLTWPGQVAGVDISRKALSKAGGVYPVYVCHGIRDGLPFPDSAFEIVNYADVLGHFVEEDRDRLLMETHRVLRSSRWFLAVVETWSSGCERNIATLRAGRRRQKRHVV